MWLAIHTTCAENSHLAPKMLAGNKQLVATVDVAHAVGKSLKKTDSALSVCLQVAAFSMLYMSMSRQTLLDGWS